MADNILTPRWRRKESLQKMDRRSRKTRNALTAALMELLETKSIKNISVTELTKRADVNRATFYVHYRDVFDMLDQVKSEICEVFEELMETHGAEISCGNYRPLIKDVFTYFEDNERLLTTLLGPHSDGTFFEAISAVLRTKCLEAIRSHSHEQGERGSEAPFPDAPEPETMYLYNYQFDFIANGIVGVLRDWLAEGRRESIERMTDIVVNYIEPLNSDVFRKNLALCS